MENEVSFNVEGKHTITVPPERGVVHGSIVLESPRADVALEQVLSAAGSLRADLERLRSGGGAVTWLSFDQVRTSVRRPQTRDGASLAPVHTASALFACKFADLEALSRWIPGSITFAGLSIAHIEWRLTSERQRQLLREVRQEAARDARQRATDYAEALGLGEVRLRQLNDTRPGRVFGGDGIAMTRSLADAKNSSDYFGLELAPEHVVVTAEVSACFVLARG